MKKYIFIISIISFISFFNVSHASDCYTSSITSTSSGAVLINVSNNFNTCAGGICAIDTYHKIHIGYGFLSCKYNYSTNSWDNLGGSFNSNYNVGSFSSTKIYPNIDLTGSQTLILSMNIDQNGSGYYRNFFKDGNNIYYVDIDVSSGNLSVIHYYESNQIISIIPQSNTTVIPFVSTSTDRSASFDIDLLEYYIATGTPYIITAKLQNNDIEAYNFYTGTYNIATTGYATTSLNVSSNVPFGNYDLSVSILDNNFNILTSTTSTNITFGSSTHAITFEEIYGSSSSDPFSISQIATSSECSITNITGCFKNAIVWAFYPNTEAMNTYQGFISTLKTRVPVGYFYLIKDSISEITATSTNLVFNITIPSHLKQYIFDPLDVGIASILWIFCVFMFYKRLKDIQL